MRLLTKPKPGQKPAWLVIDELAGLQRLPQFHTALTKGRKSGNPIVFGYQGKAQLEVIYGHLAEVMLSQPSTKFILKTAEPNAAKWASNLIGQVEIERVRETVADGKRQGKSFTLDRQIEPLVMDSEIEGLSDLQTFVKLGNSVSRFSFPHKDFPVIAPALVRRTIVAKEMWRDVLVEALTPPPAASIESSVPNAAVVPRAEGSAASTVAATPTETKGASPEAGAGKSATRDVPTLQPRPKLILPQDESRPRPVVATPTPTVTQLEPASL